MGKILNEGDIVEYNDERFKEVNDSLIGWGVDYLKKVEQPKKRAKKVVDEE